MNTPLLNRTSLRSLGIAAVAGGIVHITATLVAQQLAGDAIYQRLNNRFTPNTMHLLGPAAPHAQILPFFGADARTAVCRFDASGGPVTVEASLAGTGWSLVVYARDGAGVYVVPGQEQQRTEVKLVLMPPGDRFFPGIATPAAGQGLPEVQLPTNEGMVVVRAPLKGGAYSGAIE